MNRGGSRIRVIERRDEGAVVVGIRITPPGEAAEEQKYMCRETINTMNNSNSDIHRALKVTTLLAVVPGSNQNYKKAGSSRHLSGTCAWLQPVFQEPGASRLIAVDSSIRSTTRLEAPSSDCTRSPDEISTIGFSSKSWPETNFRRQRGGGGGGGERGEGRRRLTLGLGLV
ncbi:alpha-glucosidase [Dorcoceras hygrometricum]|uniref:Alpha-glucosidase n=1 Tax=Dorcoceras hygrometricum TaxID=472368 RepID=A0A2Z7D2Z7_9LAMI|nr:alpha-glucosidase [Dorcoceras hygrometricum]